MRLYLAVAVLMLALVAYTEAQEQTIQQKFDTFGEQVAEIARNLADKARTTFEGLHNSEVGVSSRNWLNLQVDKLKTKFEEITQ